MRAVAAVRDEFLTTRWRHRRPCSTDGARLVNQRGERFGDERDRPAWRLPDQPDKVGLDLLDQRMHGACSAVAAFHLDRAGHRLCLPRRLPAKSPRCFQCRADARCAC